MRKTVIFVAAVILGAGAYFALRNLPPELMADTAQTEEGREIQIAVLENDVDPNNDLLTVVRVEAPQNGTAVISDDGQFINYAPAQGFYGTDSFSYRAKDPDGAEATANVEVNVAFLTPNFHQRDAEASLAEMLSEPATSVYGSTIDVFLYEDASGDLREITIAGHADSLTCSVTSGAFANALLASGEREGDFLVAGAGRMSIPSLSEPSTQLLQFDPAVVEYDILANQLAYQRFFIQAGYSTLEDAAESLGMSLEEAQARLDEMRKDDAVAAYLTLLRPRRSAENFVSEALAIEEQSGLLRTHRLSYRLIEDVASRVKEAALAGGSQVVTFEDLLPSADSEAVVYVPMAQLATGEPVVITVPGTGLTPEAFSETAKLYRSDLEQAVSGSAEHRLRHATKLVERVEVQRSECETFSLDELDALRGGQSEICDKDGCVPDPDAPDITNREYCRNNVPFLMERYLSFKAEAEEVIRRLELVRQDSDIDRLDALTHAALLDSMLRDWALPFPRAQAAFDHWLEEERPLIWEAISEVMASEGIARSTLSGESVIFDVSLDGSELEIAVLHVVDVQRTRLVIDPGLGVTATVNPWELREITPAETDRTQITTNLTGVILKDPQAFFALLSANPQDIASRFFDEQMSALPVEGQDWENRRLEALQVTASEYRDGFYPTLTNALGQALNSEQAAWGYLLDLSNVAYVAEHGEYLGPEFRLSVAHVLMRGMLAYGGQAPSRAWMELKRYGNPDHSVSVSPRAEHLLFGKPFDDSIRSILAAAKKDDPDAFEVLIAAGSAPKPVAPTDEPRVETLLNRIVGQVEIARAALTMRNAIDSALLAFSSDGRAKVDELKLALEMPDDLDQLLIELSWNELNQLLAYFSETARFGELGPIEGNDFSSILFDAKNNLDARLRSLEPLLSQVRFGRDQEALVTRMLFDQGAYAEALRRLAPQKVPLSLLHTSLKWVPLDANLAAVPEQVSARMEGQSVVLTAQVAGEVTDVLRLDGLSTVDAREVLRNRPKTVVGWSEGEPIWEQLLISHVDVLSDVEKVSTIVQSTELNLPLLKAMVYACAVPATHILSAGGRCQPVSGSTRLYDRVGDTYVTFVLPDEREMRTLAVERFKRDLAWR